MAQLLHTIELVYRPNSSDPEGLAACGAEVPFVTSPERSFSAGVYRTDQEGLPELGIDAFDVAKVIHDAVKEYPYLAKQTKGSIINRVEGGHIVVTVGDPAETGELQVLASCSDLPMFGYDAFEMLQSLGSLPIVQQMPGSKPLSELTNTNRSGLIGRVVEIATGFVHPIIREQGVMTTLLTMLADDNRGKGNLAFGMFNPDNTDIVGPLRRAGFVLLGEEEQRNMPFVTILLSTLPLINGNGENNPPGLLPWGLCHINDPVVTARLFARKHLAVSDKNMVEAFEEVLKADFVTPANLAVIVYSYRRALSQLIPQVNANDIARVLVQAPARV